MALADELARLDARIEERVARWRELRTKAQTDPWPRVREAVEPLRDYFDAVRFRKREPDPTEELKLTEAFAKSAAERGLVIRPIIAGNAGTVEVWDPQPDQLAAEAEREMRVARAERDAFVAEHADELEAERKRAEMEKLRDALEGDDPVAVREALA